MNKIETVLQCQGLSKTFKDADRTLTILDRINLAVSAKESVAIVGASGSGKSTLLHLLAGLDRPDAGSIEIVGQALEPLSEKAKDQLRNQHLGFVHQFHHLLPEFNALENICMPLFIRGASLAGAKERGMLLLEQVGLKERAEQSVMTLSGGERQRVAIARALVTQPTCLLADEPTGNLDQGNAESVFELLCKLKDHMNSALIIVTHNLGLANTMDRMFILEKGQLRLAG